MDKQTLVKYIFLVVIGLVLVGITLSNLFDDSEEQTPEEMFEANTSELESDDANVIDFNKGKDKTEDTEIEQEQEVEDDIEENSEQNIETEPDYDAINREEFGERNIERAEELVYEAVKLWLENPFELDILEDYATDDVMEELKTEAEMMDGLIYKEVGSINVYGVEPENNNELRYGASVISNDYSRENGNLLHQQSQLFYVSVEQVGDDSWVITDFVDLANVDNHFH